jgi:hypothetical protein
VHLTIYVPRSGFNNATTNFLAALVLIETGARAVAFQQLGWWYFRATEQALNTLPVDDLSTVFSC